jgi:hypothetical protein
VAAGLGVHQSAIHANFEFPRDARSRLPLDVDACLLRREGLLDVRGDGAELRGVPSSAAVENVHVSRLGRGRFFGRHDVKA